MAGPPAALRRHKMTGRLASTAGTMRCGSQPHRRELCSGAVQSTAPFPGSPRRLRQLLHWAMLQGSAMPMRMFEIAAAITAPANKGMKKRLMIGLPSPIEGAKF